MPRMPYSARDKIVAGLKEGPKSWAELLNSTGLSKAALSTNLKVLTQELIVSSKVHESRKPRTAVYEIEKDFLEVREQLEQFLSGEKTRIAEFEEPGKMAPESRKRVWMVANCMRLLQSALFKIHGLQPESNLYVGVFKQKDGKLLLSIKQPSQEDRKGLRL
jgi:DNA-binding HxlR family transcriptional regulator